jgi:putative holliday junction resolvase
VTGPGRLLGVDHGTVRIGLAVTDPDRKIAFPLTTYAVRNREQDGRYFAQLIADERIAGIVVGLPVHTDGREGDRAKAARAFGTWLSEVTGRPVTYYDERFTTVQAEAALWDAGLTHKRRRERRDRVAAQMLLQAYLDAGCPEEQTPGPLTGPA